jgi:hypothetical protein
MSDPAIRNVAVRRLQPSGERKKRTIADRDANE